MNSRFTNDFVSCGIFESVHIVYNVYFDEQMQFVYYLKYNL